MVSENFRPVPQDVSTQPIEKKEGEVTFPKSVDINPTAKCNLHCSFCWGPDHTIPDGLDTAGWKSVINFFSDRGTDAVVFTGGEPLIRRDILDLIGHAKGRGMRVTLSTNTILLPRVAQHLLPMIDEIGIPIDGSTPEQNSKMRLGNKRSFAASVSALDLVKATNPLVEVTVRTVVSKVNEGDIGRIGELLEQKIDKLDRWKLYQFTPLSIGAGNADEHEMGIEQFVEIVQAARQKHPALPIVDQAYSVQPGRYVFVGPQGNVYGVVGDGTEYETVGNVMTDSEEKIETGVKALFDPVRNSGHAHNKLATEQGLEPQ